MEGVADGEFRRIGDVGAEGAHDVVALRLGGDDLDGGRVAWHVYWGAFVVGGHGRVDEVGERVVVRPDGHGCGEGGYVGVVECCCGEESGVQVGVGDELDECVVVECGDVAGAVVGEGECCGPVRAEVGRVDGCDGVPAQVARGAPGVVPGDDGAGAVVYPVDDGLQLAELCEGCGDRFD